jgi:NADH-quinone oxidoreductase subunit N
MLDDLKGLNQRHPWYAFIVMLVMFSLAGVPLTIGFFAKLTVIEAVIGVGYYWLAVVAVLASLIGAYYYLRVVKLMYFDDPVDTAAIPVRGDAHLLFSVNGLAMLVLGCVPQPLLALATRRCTRPSDTFALTRCARPWTACRYPRSPAARKASAPKMHSSSWPKSTS